ncbi:hypothetical protein D3C86_2199800 [compost metagenome]
MPLLAASISGSASLAPASLSIIETPRSSSQNGPPALLRFAAQVAVVRSTGAVGREKVAAALSGTLLASLSFKA